jgi:hypothetical protein
MVRTEPELLVIRRAFPAAQALLAGAALSRVGTTVEVGWHSTETHPELGSSHALVRSGADLDDLIGEVLKITRGDREPVFVYVLGARDLPTDVSVARRAFLALGLLAVESVECIVEVVV